MTPDDAKAVVDTVARKHKTFRHIETVMTKNGCNVTFADLPDLDPRTISSWFDKAGVVVLYVGRSYKFDGYVMHAEIKSA